MLMKFQLQAKKVKGKVKAENVDVAKPQSTKKGKQKVPPLPFDCGNKSDEKIIFLSFKSPVLATTAAPLGAKSFSHLSQNRPFQCLLWSLEFLLTNNHQRGTSSSLNKTTYIRCQELVYWGQKVDNTRWTKLFNKEAEPLHQGNNWPWAILLETYLGVFVAEWLSKPLWASSEKQFSRLTLRFWYLVPESSRWFI